MDPDPSRISLFVALALIAANAFLVAAEFALIAVRRSRIEQNVRLGAERSGRVLPPLERLEELVVAAQLARRAASIPLGVVALAIARGFLVPLGMLPLWANVVSIAAVVVAHATIGQQVPKLVAVHR